MKQEKFDVLVEEVSEFIAHHDWASRHPIFDEEIIAYFKELGYKKKQVKKAIEEVR